MANKLRPEPMPSATNALLGAIGQFYENDGLAGLLGMTSVNRQIHDATQAQLAAPDIRSGVAAAVENPMTMAVGPATIRAYHGSPYSFDKFDLAKIGTGEGAQAYGHGLYFAEKEGVARSYRDALSGKDWGLVDNTPVAQQSAAHDWVINKLREHLSQVPHEAGVDGGIPAAFDARLAEMISSMKEGAASDWARTHPDNAAAYAQNIPRMEEALRLLRGGQVQLQAPGHMYEVNLHADPAALLDWDKPLSQQSALVRDAMLGQPAVQRSTQAQARILGDKALDPTGQSAYADLTGWRRGVDLSPPAQSAIAASSTLNAAGIPGIKYLDGGSRGSGTGTSNYVMFDPARVEILRKYGLLPAAAVGAGAVSSGADAALTPVDHDPFGAPLVSVDHDPFGGQ